MNFELSNYQKDILNYVKSNNNNLLIDAKAGSGKTSTLILIAEELLNANQNCLFLSFNKSIVDELKLKIPELSSNIKTVHSLGLTFIRSYLYKKHNTNYVIKDMDLSKKKVRELVKMYYEKYFAKEIAEYHQELSEQELKDTHYEIITDFVNVCNYARLYCCDFTDKKQIEHITLKFARKLPEYINDVLPNYYELVPAVINAILNMFEHPEKNMEGKYEYAIDFLDMIYLPVQYSMNVPFAIKNSLDTILVDESQDLSLLQQMFIRRLYTGSNRFIFVGDRNQSIYGFSGADTKAVDRIKDNFRPKELPLSICYRCPEKIVRLAREIVPTIEWNKDRLDTGTLKTIDYTDMRDNISQGEIIIGRRNKDLLKIYKDFTFNLKREIKFRNKDLVNAIEKDLITCIRDYMLRYTKKLNMEKYVMTILNEFAAINNIPVNSNLYKTEKATLIDKYIAEHKDDKKDVMKSNQTLEYLIKCMQEYHDEGAYEYEEDNILTVYYDIILDFINIYRKSHTSILVNDFMEYMKNFLNASLNKYNVPIISSVHSMKGGEADTVYIYDYPKFPYKHNSMTKDEIQQERNLQYVAITRAKKNLYLVLCDTSTAKSPEQLSFIQAQNQECIEHVEEINKLVDDLKASKYNQ